MTAALEAYQQAHLLTESELKGHVVKMARERGWMVFHQSMAKQTRPVRRQGNADATGFPDLVLAREGDEPLFLELKAQNGVQDIDQVKWMCALPRYEVIRPSDLARGRVDELLA